MDKFPGDAAKIIDQSKSFLLRGGGGGGEGEFGLSSCMILKSKDENAVRVENCRKSPSPADHTPLLRLTVIKNVKNLTENTIKLSFLSQNIHGTSMPVICISITFAEFVPEDGKYYKQPLLKDKNHKCCRSFISYELIHTLGFYIRFIPLTVQKQN